MNSCKIFIVEDDPWYGEILEYHISQNPDNRVTRYGTAKDCLGNLYREPDLICLDFTLPDMSGEELYRKIREVHKELPVIVISAQEKISVAVKLLKMGVSDYLVKDESTKELLWNSINRVKENLNLKQQVEQLKVELEQKFSFEKSLIGASDALKRIFQIMEKAVKTNINVSITGETGTGKEIVAKAIHYNSELRKKPFVAVNMAAIPRDLVESELFGYEKGAFTGANYRKIGKFEEANGGTIFLDEIAELDLSLQSKILRVLQEREVERLGSSEKVKLQVRLIIATHKNLLQEVQEGRFREDLYYRVLGLPIELPPLRERGNDILILAKHFAEEFSRQNRMGSLNITKEAKDKLLKYTYPGNVRELKAMIDLAAVLCENNEIRPEDIQINSPKVESSFIMEQKSLKEYTFDIIKYYLKKNNNDVMATAKVLEIGKSTIYKLMQTNALA